MGFSFKLNDLEVIEKVVHNYCVKVTKNDTLRLPKVSILQAFLQLPKNTQVL